MTNNNSLRLKSFAKHAKKLNLSYIRYFCSNCLKTLQIAFDDLEAVYSRSDFCHCARRA
jgi:hypothetical protein